ncbi:6690_t:CDS:1 [Funneliformis geosporum]|nr:6690_t:CDS:1 [Funneliformis geosporum]
MACSKLFLGNLPEVTNQIIQYLRNDLKSLYSCIFVNRHLCQITIPILWEDPFVICRGHNYNFLEIYYFFFNDGDKVELKEKYGITINPSSPNKPLFNYPSLLKSFNVFRFEMHVINWINHLDCFPSIAGVEPTQARPSRKIFLPNLIEDIGFDIKKNLPNSIEIIDSICILLFKLFINSDASLNNLRLLSSSKVNFLPEMHKLILTNPKITSDLKVISLDVSNEPILTSLLSISSSIRQLNLYYGGKSTNVSSVIRSQSRLSSLSFDNLTYDVYLMNAFKFYPQTLTSIEFKLCNFTNISSLEGIQYLSQLKSLYFFHCRGLTVRAFQSLLVHPNPLKIKTLRVHGRNPGINLLLRKVGLELEHLDLMLFERNEREKAFDTIINYCYKIKFLLLSWINSDDTYQLFELITRVNNHIKYLSLENLDSCQLGSNLLKELGQILPDSLRYLVLCIRIDANDLKIFLNNCKHIKLTHLLVSNFNVKNIDLIFSLLKEFVKKQKVKNFAYQISSSFDPNNDEHRNFEKLFDEIQPFVNMKKYSDLVIKISDL